MAFKYAEKCYCDGAHWILKAGESICVELLSNAVRIDTPDAGAICSQDRWRFQGMPQDKRTARVFKER
jgi:hypothetical protein